MPRLTPHQRKVLDRLRAGEYIYHGALDGKYHLSDGGRVLDRTFDALLRAGLIQRQIAGNDWVATGKETGK